MRHSLNGRESVFQTEYMGSIPICRNKEIIPMINFDMRDAYLAAYYPYVCGYCSSYRFTSYRFTNEEARDNHIREKHTPDDIALRLACYLEDDYNDGIL